MNDGCPLARERVISGNWFQVLLQLESLLSEGKGDWVCLGSPIAQTWGRHVPNDGKLEYPRLILNHPVWAYMLSLLDHKTYASFRRVDLLSNLLQLASDQRRRVLFICPKGKRNHPRVLQASVIEHGGVVIRDSEKNRSLADLIVQENIFVVVNASGRFRVEDRIALQKQTKKGLLWVDAPKQAGGLAERTIRTLRFLWFRSKEPYGVANWANWFSLRSK